MTYETDFSSGARTCRIIDLPAAVAGRIAQMPHIHCILLENVLRTVGENSPRAQCDPGGSPRPRRGRSPVPARPGADARHDLRPGAGGHCGHALDLAEAGHDPALLNPVLPVDVSMDHSLSVDFFGGVGAMQRNIAKEYCRNAERYRFMEWATNTLDGVRVHPPGTGIMHTLNLERLATVVEARDDWAMPDAMIGTDSHTPMINGIGVPARASAGSRRRACSSACR